MPTYEYECDACAHTMEAFQSMSDKALRKCPACNKLKLQRLIGAGAGIIFKGSGFYETDYKRKSPPATESASGDKSGGSSDSASGGPSAKGGDAPRQSDAGAKVSAQG